MDLNEQFQHLPLLPEVWRNKPEVIYEFLNRKPRYDRLCQEVAYTLKTSLKDRDIEFSSIKWRSKDLNSFLEKLDRKQYKKPFDDITDLAGVRVVCLYPSDLEKIEKIIYREFEVVEKVDKRSLAAVDRIGYSALHYLIRLGNKFSGARYDDLHDLICEIQVRTVLQDAWATIDHHLVYKQRSLIPEELRRRINDLAKVMDKADEQFEKIRCERLAYIKKLETTRSRRLFLNREINLDSFKAFCERTFPDVESEKDIRFYNRILKWINPERYKTLRDLEQVAKTAEPVLNDVVEELTQLLVKRGIEVDTFTNLAYMQVSLDIVDKDFRIASEASPEFMKILKKFDCRLEPVN